MGAQEDPSFRVETDEESGQTIISGMGELHLDIIVDRMRREFSVECNVGKPQVAYRECITSSVEINAEYMGQSGGRGQYGHVWLKLEPMDIEGEETYEFVNEIVGGVGPKEYIPAVDKGIQEQMKNGVLGGFPVLGVKATLYDGSFHDVDLNRRRGMIEGMEEAPAGMKAINAQVPLAEMFGYATDLRSATQGRASYSMEFLKYAEAPNNVADAIVTAR